MSTKTNHPPTTQYELVAARRDASKAQVWQVPLLGVTIQAFLLTAALSEGNEHWSRLLAAALGFLTALASAQLLARHRLFETADAQWLTRYERIREAEGWLDISDRDFPARVIDLPNGDPKIMLPKGDAQSSRRWWNPMDHSSYRLWMVILFLFAAVSGAIFISVLVRDVIQWPAKKSGAAAQAPLQPGSDRGEVTCTHTSITRQLSGHEAMEAPIQPEVATCHLPGDHQESLL